MRCIPCVIVAMACSLTHADLEPRLGGLAVYDTDWDVTFLADANFAQTSGFDDDGALPRADAEAWVESLVIAGVGGWRLPQNPQFDPACFGQGKFWNDGAFCVNGDLGHLLIVENDISLFTNVVPWFYWSSLFDDGSFVFNVNTEILGYFADATAPLYVWPVHDGDVGDGCPADFNGDGTIDFEDLNTILGMWGMNVGPGTSGDTNGDGMVNFDDLNRVLADWATSCP